MKVERGDRSFMEEELIGIDESKCLDDVQRDKLTLKGELGTKVSLDRQELRRLLNAMHNTGWFS